jgi:hypothetical protein
MDPARRVMNGIDPETRERLAALVDRQLSPGERAAYENAPMSDEEREEIQNLVRWFCTRYPTAAERLAWCRRATARWRASQPR